VLYHNQNQGVKTMNDLLQYLMEAYDIVSAWDLPDEDLTQAVLQQAYLMANIDPNTLFEV
jgi:hypothetical protein